MISPEEIVYSGGKRVGLCCVEDCGRVAQLTRGMCQKHYLRLKKYGSTGAPPTHVSNPYGKPSMLTLWQTAAIRVEYDEGGRISEMAARWGVSSHTVRRAIQRTGGTIRPFYLRGEDHGRWKGGRFVDPDGYVRVWVPAPAGERKRGTTVVYEFEHRLVMAQHIGRPLLHSETVHHINGDRADNRIANLQLRSSAHGPGQVRVCLDCGSHNVGTAPL